MKLLLCYVPYDPTGRKRQKTIQKVIEIPAALCRTVFSVHRDESSILKEAFKELKEGDAILRLELMENQELEYFTITREAAHRLIGKTELYIYDPYEWRGNESDGPFVQVKEIGEHTAFYVRKMK